MFLLLQRSKRRLQHGKCAAAVLRCEGGEWFGFCQCLFERSRGHVYVTLK